MNNTFSSKTKKNTWLWVLGWIFVFPLPLTILLIRSTKLNKGVKSFIIIIGWILYALILLSGGQNDNSSDISRNTSEADQVTSNIEKLEFIDNDDVTVEVGKKISSSYVKVEAYNTRDFVPDDLVFVSDNPEIATIGFSHDSLTTYVYYEITGISPGETSVYVTSKDGSVSTERINVIVPKPIEVDHIEIVNAVEEMTLGEKLSLNTIISPENAENQEVTWTSSNDSIINVSPEGIVSAVGGGMATITATASNGVSSSFDVTVDGSKRQMKLKVSHSREDDNNIGDEWSYINEINGEPVSNTITISVGDNLVFSSKYTEDDSKPDVGEASKSYSVTEDDLVNGFEIQMDLYVTENGGKNKGKSAHFLVCYSITPNDN